MGSAVSTPEDTSVVIIGGGYGGVTLAQQLKSTGKVKLVNPSDHLFHNIGALRAAVEPGFAKYMFIPFKETFGDAFVRGTIVSIKKEAKSVTLASGEEIRYSHLILATGSSGHFPGKLAPTHLEATKDGATQLFRDLNGEIEKADTVVVVGGGAVGTELAGEIKTDYHEKEVTLVHPTEILCSKRLNKKAQASLHKAMEEKGIKLLLGERVVNLSELELNKCVKAQEVKLQSGEEVKADLIIPCTGLKPATDAFKDALGAAVTDQGLIKVDQFFKVEGTDDIYAIGDITDTDEEKTCVAAMNHGELLGKNFIASFRGNNMKPYKSQAFMMVIPLGRSGGVAQIGGIVFGGFAARNIKGTHLFYPKYWELMGQKAPK